MADQHTKRMQYPGNDSSSTTAGPRKKKTQSSEEGTQVTCWPNTVDTGFDMNMSSKNVPANTAYCQRCQCN